MKRFYIPPLWRVHLATALFGTAGLFAVSTGLDSILITFGRTLFAALALLVIMVVSAQPSQWQLDIRSVASGVLLAMHWTLFFLSIQLSNVAVGLIMFASSAVFIALLEPLVFRESFKHRNVICALFVVMGIFFIVSLDSAGSQLLAGVGVGLLSSVLFALLQLLNRSLSKDRSAISLSLIQNAVAAAVVFPAVFVDLPQVTINQWLQLILLGCVCTAFAHTIFISALRRIKASLAGLIAGGLEPVYGAILAAGLLAQYPEMNVWIGGALVLAAVFYAQSAEVND